MRKIALGRLRIPASEFYLMTLAELFDAIAGHNEQYQQDLEWRLWATRKVIAHLRWVNGDKDWKEEDAFPLEIDEELRKARYESMTPIKVTVND